MKEKRKRMKGDEKERKEKGEMNMILEGILKNAFHMGHTVICILKMGPTSSFLIRFSSVLQSGCVRLKVRCVGTKTVCFSTDTTALFSSS